MKPYEIHITSIVPDYGQPNSKKLVRQYNQLAEEEGWKTSRINGDPILGEGVKFYFTKHADSEKEAFELLNIMTDRLRDNRIKILREKIEFIVFDTKDKKTTVLN